MNLDGIKKRIAHQDFPLGLATGKTGLCVCLFILGRKVNNPEYTSLANDILYDVLDKTQNLVSIDMKHGLVGLGIALNYLVNNHYIAGDLNYILTDADDLVLKHLNPKNEVDFDADTLLDLLFYIVMRLENKSIKKDYRYLFEETSIEYINKLSFKLDSAFFEESIPFTIENKPVRLLYLLSFFYKLNFYNSRLDVITHEISYKLLSNIPILHSNKLLLLGGMSSVKNYIILDKWQKHIDLLKNEFDIDILIREEIREKNISLCNGIAGVLLSFQLSQKEFLAEKFNIIKDTLSLHFNVDNLEKSLLNPKFDETSFLYGEIGALTISTIL